MPQIFTELYTDGCRVWIPHKEQVWICAIVSKNFTKNDKELNVIDEDGNNQIIKIKDEISLPPLRNPDILQGCNDLTCLSYLHEPAVLHNLKIRFINQNSIYTWCGIVLVAVNPFSELNIYGDETIQTYHQSSLGNTQLDPHIYAVAEEAFSKLERESYNQSIIVSGESGAGKTVSAKYAMRYFAYIAVSHTTNIENKVLASNPIMEAIGNAKTIRNDNSSRFGKYIQIVFDPYSRSIIGGHMSTYLLEKFRVSFQSDGERNFHIFYQFVNYCRKEKLDMFRLDSNIKFDYLGDVEPTNHDKINEFLSAMLTLGFTEKQQDLIFRILASILHAGNIQFNSIDDDQCEISNDDFHLKIFCQLLDIEFETAKKWLTNRVIRGGLKEIIVSPISSSAAIYARDALSKFIYERMFQWIVNIINKALNCNGEIQTFIGVLDIFGFENFQPNLNSLEQFNINYANEKLQQQFNRTMFKLEQDEYVKEGIDWQFIKFTDNQPVINLIEAKPIGILNLLDEECKMPRGSDESFCSKIYQHIKLDDIFQKPKIGSSDSFVIQHFADKVVYQVTGFLEKNRDTVCDELVDLVKNSMANVLFSNSIEEETSHKSTSGKLKITPQKQGSPKGGSSQSANNKATISSQFKESLGNLMKILNSTTPHYVRCIKSNDTKSPFEFDNARVVQQLRACGVLETINISSLGFPSRWTYTDFANRYRPLLFSLDQELLAQLSSTNKATNRVDTRKIVRSDTSTVKQLCQDIVKIVYDNQIYSQFKLPNEQRQQEQKEIYQFGKTKLFFRAGQVALLERIRTQKLRDCAILMQKVIRGWLVRRTYVKIKETILKLQTYSRSYLARKEFRRLRQERAAIRIQSHWKAWKARVSYLKLRQSILLIQTRARGYLARERMRYYKEHQSAIVIQKVWKGYQARKQYRLKLRQIVIVQSLVRKFFAKKVFKQLKIEARSVDHVRTLNRGLESKIVQLQQKIENLKIELGKTKSSGNEVQELKTDKAKLANEIRNLKNVIIGKNKEVEFLKRKSEEEKQRSIQLESKLDEIKFNYEELKKKFKQFDINQNKRRELEEQFVEKEKEIIERFEREKRILLQERESEKSAHQQLLRKYSALEDKLLHSNEITDDYNYDMSRGPDFSTVSLMMRCSELEQEKAKLKHENEELRLALVNNDGSTESQATKVLAQNYNMLERELDRVKEERKNLKTIVLGQDSLKEPMAEGEVISAFKSIIKHLETELDSQKELNEKLGSLSLRSSSNAASSNQENESLKSVDSSSEEHVMKLNQEKMLLKQKCNQLMEDNNRLTIELLRRNVVGVGNENYYVGESKDTVNKNFLGMFEFSQRNTALITKILITNLEPADALKFPPCYPAYIMFMCIRYTDFVNDENQVKNLLNEIIGCLRRRARSTNSVEVLSLWLANVCSLLTCLKQFSGDEYFGVLEESLKSFDLFEYRQIFNDAIVHLSHNFLRLSEEKIQPLIVPAILEYEGLASSGICSQPSNLNRSGSISSSNEQDDTLLSSPLEKPVNLMINELSDLYKCLLLHDNQPEMIFQIFKQLFFFICAGALNNLLLRKDLCVWNKAMQIRFNLSVLEQWCRETQIPNCNEIIDQLNPITQATKLLQTKKSEDNISTIVEMCNKLSSSQIMKILNLYTAVDEENISEDFLKKIQTYLKEQRKDDVNKSTLLIDTKHIFPITIPYKPVDIKLQNISLPPFLLKMGLGTVLHRL